ncbi:MAG: 1-acyl-sn-glycerol-3-phosphate acyltransferase [Deltaproteobacteria bacterium]|nr:1-acyl-sn-glycerol-3-phosphate acyltransferase [Deltaproteobacteria bacterium]
MICLVVRALRTAAATIFSGAVAVVACAMLFDPRRMWLTCCRPWARGTLALGGIRIDVVGGDHLAGPAVFVSNHQSTIDVVFLPAVLPRTVRFLAKKELNRVPLWGWALASGGAIMIDRKDPQGAVHSIQEGLKKLPAGWSVAVFPEGTRSQDGTLQPFKKGAFHIAMHAGLPMVPIGIAGAKDVMPKYSRLLRPGTVYLTIGAPIPTGDWQLATIDAHVAEVREAVRACIAASDERRSAGQILARATGERRLP